MKSIKLGTSNTRIRFVQVGHETIYASSENKHIFTNHVIIRHTEIIKDLRKAST